MRPSTAEEDVYLEELMGKILSEREDSLLKLTQVVHDIEERLKWEQAANEARFKDIKHIIRSVDGRLQNMSAPASSHPANARSLQHQQTESDKCSKDFIQSPYRGTIRGRNGSELHHQKSSLRHAHTADALHHMTERDLEQLDNKDILLAVPGDKNGDGKINDADLLYVADVKEKEAQDYTLFSFIKLIVWDVWYPNQIPRIPWDNLMLLTMVYIIFATPYIIAFNLDMNTLSSSNPSQWLAILDLVICGIFCTDMLFNFKTAYMKKTKQANMVFMTKRSDIFFHYMAFWFWLDLVTSIPWEFVIDSESIAGPVSDVQAARVIRILRIWRLVQLIRLMKELSKQNSKNIFDYLSRLFGRENYAMYSLAFSAACLVHWAGCSFYWAASWTNFNEDTWVYHQNLVPNEADGNVAASYGTRYVYSIYWATVTMATVGYGDIVAYSIGEKFMAMFWIVLGACMFAYLMGNMTAMLTSYDPAKAYQLKQEADVQNFVEKRHVPVALAKNITHYYSFKVRREYREDEMAIINGLPNRIKDEVTLHLHKDFVRSIPMFADKTPKFIAEILERLSLDFVQPGDVVVWQGETCLETFFLAEGIIDVRLYNMEELMFLKEELENSQANVDDDVVEELGDKLIRAMGRVMMGGAKVMAAAEGQAQTQFDFVVKLAKLPSKLIGKLRVGNTFGGPGCFEGDECPVAAVAKTDCELHCLDPDKLHDVKEHFPEFLDEIDSLGADCKMTALLQRAIDEVQKKKEVAFAPNQTLGGFGGMSMQRRAYTPYAEIRAQSRPGTANRRKLDSAGSARPLILSNDKSDSIV